MVKTSAKNPAIFVEFLLFDRFVCGLNDNELNPIRCVSESWTFKQLLEHFLDENNADRYMEAGLTLDIVKSEPVCLFLESFVYKQ